MKTNRIVKTILITVAIFLVTLGITLIPLLIWVAKQPVVTEEIVTEEVITEDTAAEPLATEAHLPQTDMFTSAELILTANWAA